MAQLPMYAAAVNSPSTELAADTTATATSIEVLDASKLPAAPNLVTVGGDETAETIMYSGKTGNTLTGCTRGFEGTAKGWAAGSPAARNHTAYDYEAGRANIADLDTRVSNIAIPDGTTAQKGIVQLSDATDGTRSTVAATEKAVNDVRLAAASDATSKGNSAEANSKAYSDGLIGSLSNLQTSAKSNTVAAINELFTSVSNGKTAIAAAITGKGVPATGSDTFSQMASKIGQIQTGAQSASGITTSGASVGGYFPLEVSGLTFKPNIIVFRRNDPNINYASSSYSELVTLSNGSRYVTVVSAGTNPSINIVIGQGLNVGNFFVHDSGFKMPASYEGVAYAWAAFRI
ncbi:phage tail protein [Paenibacillus xylanexedens]|uniref:phage tail protein n=1 Tax=Paenibacillus xylanexedens TaxID=528191 RepID=UPI0011A9B53A|nr:phage tail protein [Paenibacillus xylanexedens]